VKQIGPACLLQEFLRSQKRWQVFGNTVKGGWPGMSGPVLFGALDLLPIDPDLIHILNGQISKDMWMSPNQLRGDMTYDFIEIKGPTLFAQLAMKNHLQQKIAQFLRYFMVVLGFYGVEQLINFFDRMPTERHVILFSIPGTAFGRAQSGHDLE